MNKTIKIVITLLIIAIVMLLCFIGYLKINQEDIFFTLYGEEYIELYEGDTYKELGFIAKDKKGALINNRVDIDSNLDTNITGEYYINYIIKTKLKTYTLTRTIKVLSDPLKNITFTLNGAKVMNITINEDFNDPLYSCTNNQTKEDLSNYIQIENNINNQEIGTYFINYTLKIDEKIKNLTRTVNVLEKKYNYILNTTEPTNNDITINFTSFIPNFSHIILPDNNSDNNSSIVYQVKENGDYKFVVYDMENNYEEYHINIENIDKEPPIINSCTGIITNNQTKFTINTNSNDISKYLINNLELINNTMNSKIENATLTVIDHANNQTSLVCSTYYEEKKPQGNENILHNSASDTLKIWIEKTDRQGRISYYTTHIWAKNPYKQFKMQVPTKFGSELTLANDLLNNAINENNLQGKIIVAINASGFVKKGVWGTSFYNADSRYNLTGASPLILANGKVYRDLSSAKYPNTNYVVYGLKNNNTLAYYKYKAGTNLAYNIDLSKKIINDGVLNTFAFDPVLVFNGQKQDGAKNNSRNIRQGLCQIDKNNFIFITDLNEARTGFSFSEMADYMLSLGCQIGFNLDGGGSTSLIFKDKNTTSIITGNKRQLADIIYFHE